MDNDYLVWKRLLAETPPRERNRQIRRAYGGRERRGSGGLRGKAIAE
jgi:hypothetical protein